MDTNKTNANDLIHHDDAPTVGDEVGEAAGGISGVVTGAAIGSIGGPVGTIIGGVAGAIGGWWAGRAVSEAAKNFTEDHETYYRNHYETSPSKLADRSYDQVKPAYQMGHVAGQNPEYKGRDFEHVESDLRRGWDNTASTAHGEWDKVKGYAREAYQRSASSMGRSTDTLRDETNRELNTNTDASQTPSRGDDVYDRVNPSHQNLL